MANNLSNLIADAFTIYSEAYRKIGRIGEKVAELQNSPEQPELWKQLVFATRLYRVISPSIVLNQSGTAIIGVVGDIDTINNLLLKLKRAVKLYTQNIFPTPLTDIVFVFGQGGGGGAGVNSTFVTVLSEAGLPQSRRIAQGDGISIVDNGAQQTIQIVNSAGLSSLQVDSSVNLVLDMASLAQRLFFGSVAINGLRSWSLQNAGAARRLQVLFSITGLTPGDSTHDQTLWPNTNIFTFSGMVPVPGVWRPIENGQYELTATTYDGVNWRVTIL